MRRLILTFAFAFTATCLACVGGVSVRAQDLDDVTIGGRVTDETGAVIRGAEVRAARAGTDQARIVLTDAEGRFRMVEMPAGEYMVRVSKAGFASEEKTRLDAAAGASLSLDFVLRPAGVSAGAVVVSEADTPLVDVTRTTVGTTVTREELETLPLNSRAPLDFVFTLGGVTEEPLSLREVAEDRTSAASGSIERGATTPEEAGLFALAGGVAYSNNLTIDGLDNNDDRAARERFQPSLEAIEEVQVITNQFSAEYGRASGGRVNLRTRGGTNRFRGRLFYFFRDEALDANSFNNNRRGLKRLPLQQHTGGFTLSAPVLLPARFLDPLGYDGRGRTFFFFAYERDATLDSALIDTLVPVERNPLFLLPAPTTLAGRRFETRTSDTTSPAELAPFVERVGTPLIDEKLTARLDHGYTATHNATFLFQHGRTRNLRQFGGGLRLADALQARTRRTRALSYSDNYVFSSAVVNQLRLQASELIPETRAREAARPVVLINLNDSLDAEDGRERSGTLVAGSSTSGASARRERRWQLQESLTVVAGAHTLKLGGDFQSIRSTFVDLTDATGTFTFSSAAAFLSNTPSRYRQSFGGESTQKNMYAGLFVQDEWRPRPGLTVSFGLRYERESIIRDPDNFAPRLGVAYAPNASGKMVLRFGAGLFFNRVLLRTVDDFTLGRQLLEFDTNLLPVATRAAFIADNIRFPQTLLRDSPLVASPAAAPERSFSRRLDEHLRIPESYQFNFGVEREVARGLALEANYSFNRGIHLWREFNANAPRLPAGYRDFADYLLSRDFPNFRSVTGVRPVYNASSAGELVRFVAAPTDPTNTDAITRTSESGIPISLINLNSYSSTAAIEAALAALASLRPDPTRTQLEQLISAGNSFYHGLTVEARRRLTKGFFGFSFRAAYTLSRLVDDGVVNTSSALRVGDFRGERARSLLDRRHRFVFSGMFDAPRRWPLVGGWRLSPILRAASEAPFNLTLGGTDRNLDDVGNDRPIFRGDVRLLRARRRGEALDPRLPAAFSLPTIGRSGNLPRNAGRAPGLMTFDLSLTREFRLGERGRLRPVVEIDNVLNHTVFTFGAEFVNFNALKPSATPAQRQVFLEQFLVPTRTLRPRQIRLGVRFDF